MRAVPTVCLPERQLFQVTDASSVRILCTAGCLWLTLDHDQRDVILYPGDSFTAESPRRALLYACEPSAFALETQAVPQRAVRWTLFRKGADRSHGVWAAARVPSPG